MNLYQQSAEKIRSQKYEALGKIRLDMMERNGVKQSDINLGKYYFEEEETALGMRLHLMKSPEPVESMNIQMEFMVKTVTEIIK